MFSEVSLWRGAVGLLAVITSFLESLLEECIYRYVGMRYASSFLHQGFLLGKTGPPPAQAVGGRFIPKPRGLLSEFRFNRFAEFP